MVSGGEVLACALDVVIVDGFDGFHSDRQILVVKHFANAAVFQSAQCEYDSAADGGGFILSECEHGGGIADLDHALDSTVTEVFILVVTFFCDGHQRGHVCLGAEFACGNGG